MRFVLVLILWVAPAAGQEPAGLKLVAIEALAGGAPVVDTAVGDLDADGRADILFLIGGEGPTFAVAFQNAAGDGFGPPRRLPIPAGTAAFGIADLLPATGKEIFLLAASGVSVRTTGIGAAPRPYAALDLVFPPESAGMPRWWDYGRDLDGDGRDDLLLPGLDGAWLVRGGGDGGPTGPPVPVRIPAEMRAARDPAGLLSWRFRSPRVAFRSLVKPGVLHPVYQDGAGLRRLNLLPDGGFGGTPSLHFGFGGGGQGALGVLQRSSIRVEDLDGNGLDDVVLARSRAEGNVVPELRSELLFFLNRGRPASTPSHALVLSGNLSSGPDLIDADGDGVRDLWLSVEGAGMKSGIQRLLGKIKLTWYLYRGTGAEPPFGRTPDITLEDAVPDEVYNTWGRRHRFLLDQDWNGDGRNDLARLSGGIDGEFRLQVLAAAAAPAPYRLNDAPAASITVNAAVRAHRSTSLAPGRSAIQLDLLDRAIFLTPDSRSRPNGK